MQDDQARIALAEAISLHDERLAQANARCSAARAELDAANIHLNQVIEARRQFMRYVAPRNTMAQRTSLTATEPAH